MPSYLHGDDGVFNLSYFDLLIGFDLTVFASYYEPWGYTPLESLAFRIPTVTTTLAGFGLWVKDEYGEVKNGITVAAGSDCPVVPVNPLMGVYAAVSRKSGAGKEVVPEEKVSPLEALRMYTISAAKSGFEEEIKGSIAPGKLADMVILSQDLFAIDPKDITKTRILYTILGGKIVYEKTSSE